MAKRISTNLHWLGRFVNVLIGLSLMPLALGVALGIRQQLESWLVGQKSFAEWVALGALSYLGLHVFVYKPTFLFRVQHRLLSRLSVWLFGGQVSTTTTKGEPAKAEKKGKEKRRGAGEGPQGSTLLVLSPYLIPLYTLFACLASWALKHWLSPGLVDPSAGIVVGATLMLHWVMAADDLQQDRNRFPPDAYLLALSLIALVSVVVVSVCLPMAVPDFSLPSVFAEALARARTLYAAVLHTLF